MLIFTERVIQIISGIKSGSVMSYGEIARLAGNPRGARQVSRILHSMSKKYNLPWHRVVNKDYEISLRNKESVLKQKELLEREGHYFEGNRIVMKR